ncbi:MAG: class I SAM-dependent methyltransferase [ANME-2 cluster archaeon]|nr:class I SAM-dependent methyltransferase [ANME-2 cluster archaeon]
MNKIFRIEGIPSPIAWIYSLIAKKNLIMGDLYKEVAYEVTSTITSGNVLDVGTGPGYLPFEIARRSSGLEITGIEFSPGMVEIARKNASDRGLSDNVEFQLASAADLPFEDGHFDVVLSTLSLHHRLHPAEYITEIHRVLKIDGEAWIYDIRRDTTKETNAKPKRKYGWWLSFIFLNIVRAHSSIRVKEVEEIISSLEISFSSTNILDTGVFLKLQLSK